MQELYKNYAQYLNDGVVFKERQAIFCIKKIGGHTQQGAERVWARIKDEMLGRSLFRHAEDSYVFNYTNLNKKEDNYANRN